MVEDILISRTKTNLSGEAEAKYLPHGEYAEQRRFPSSLKPVSSGREES